MPNLGIFGLKLENKIVIFEINILEFFLITKFCEVIKMSKFGTKNDLFGYFWAIISKNYCYF